MDSFEEEARFARGGLAEGDDADFIGGLGMCNGHWHTGQKSKGYDALFSVGEAIVPVSVGEALKNTRGVDEVQAMLFQVDGSLALGPGETHTQV